MTASVTASTGSVPTKNSASRGDIVKAITVAMTSMTGERVRLLIIWCMVIRTVFTSVVARVIRLGVENLSVLAKEKL